MATITFLSLLAIACTYIIIKVWPLFSAAIAFKKQYKEERERELERERLEKWYQNDCP